MSETSPLEDAARLSRPSWNERNPKVLLLLLVPFLAGLAFLAVPEKSSWLTLTVSGLSIGMAYFIMASGLTLVSGLIKGCGLRHGVVVSLGAVLGIAVYWLIPHGAPASTATLNLVLICEVLAATMIVAGMAGIVTDRLRRSASYGGQLILILLTVAGLVIATLLISAVNGAAEFPLHRLEVLTGAFTWRGAVFHRYELVALVLGLLVLLMLRLVLRRTKFGLIVRAGIENGKMVEVLGYRLKLVFGVILIAGVALALFGGFVWGQSQEVIAVDTGSYVAIVVFAVLVVAGLGSVEGCFIAAILFGLVQSYTNYFEPKLVPVSYISLTLLLLLWRAKGLLPIVNSR